MDEVGVELGHLLAEDVRGGVGVLHGVLVALLDRAQEGLHGVGVLGREVVVGGDDRGVVVEDRVHRDEAEVVVREVLDNGVLHGPGLVDPHGVEHVGAQAGDLVVHLVGHELDLGEVAAVGLHHAGDRGLLDGHVPGGVGVALHGGGVRDAVLLAAHDAGGVVLDDRGHGRVGHRLVGGQVVGDVVLVGDAHLSAAGTDEGVRAVRGRLDDLDLEALVGKVAVGQRHVDARVVGVGRVVQDKGDLGLLGVAGVVARGGRAVRALDDAGVVVAGGQGDACRGGSGGGDELAAVEAGVEVLIAHCCSFRPSSRA